MSDVLGVIPARYGSTRLPGKPIKKINDSYLIELVYENVKKCNNIDDIIVATDDERIAKIVEEFDGKYEMTSSDHTSGTDRVAEVARDYNHDYIVNIQGDEPFLDAKDIDQCIKNMTKNNAVMGSLGKKNITKEELNDSNTVKVLIDKNKNAIYFSRQKIPYIRNGQKIESLEDTIFKHIGLYVYQKDFLLKFTDMPESRLEACEKLEQLRALEAGYKIHMTKTINDSLGVDTPEDLKKAERIINNNEC